jgi:NhaP-type Na+/H+ or K+/H+ antiporter
VKSPFGGDAMVRMLSDRLRRAEVLLLGCGAFAASVLLIVNAGDDLRHFIDGRTPGPHAAIYGLKLMLMEAALLAPFLVLALLSRSLLRETTRHRYRWAGMAISLAASVGVVAMLMAGLIPVELEEAMDTLLVNVVPALVFLSACALLYGGLIWLAQHARLEVFIPSKDGRSSPQGRD